MNSFYGKSCNIYYNNNVIQFVNNETGESRIIISMEDLKGLIIKMEKETKCIHTKDYWGEECSTCDRQKECKVIK